MLVSAFLAFCAAPSLGAEEPGSSLRLSLLTMSPGDQSFTKFGHDALLVEDTATGSALVYNYGTFVFDSPWLAIDFLRGNLKYWLSVSTLPHVIRHYAAERRAITAQELALPPAERWRIADFLARTERSDTRYYKYDYYRDNCATRVRDVIDGAVGGRLRAASQAPAPLTYREETLRLTADDTWLSLGLDLAMGPLIDRPLTVWQSEFLPARLQAAVRGVLVPAPGGDTPLVTGERVLLPAPGRTLRESPPRRWPSLLGAGVASCAALAGLGLLSQRNGRVARALLAVLVALLGLSFGVLGTVIVGLFSLTDHAVTYFDANVLLATPTSLALPFFALGIGKGRPRALRRARDLSALSLVTSALVLAAQPFLTQKNLGFVCFFLPLWLGATLGLTLAGRTSS